MRRFILFLTIACLGITIHAANHNNIHFRNITVEDGLLANGVRNIVQDRFGFIWFGTDNGLCRYDGTSIYPFRIMENGANQFISALMADEDGLYVGTDKGVFFFQFHLENFQRIAPEIRSTVRGFSLDRDGQVWISMDGHSVFRYVPKTKQVKKYMIPSPSASMTAL